MLAEGDRGGRGAMPSSMDDMTTAAAAGPTAGAASPTSPTAVDDTRDSSVREDDDATAETPAPAVGSERPRRAVTIALGAGAFVRFGKPRRGPRTPQVAAPDAATSLAKVNGSAGRNPSSPTALPLLDGTTAAALAAAVADAPATPPASTGAASSSAAPSSSTAGSAASVGGRRRKRAQGSVALHAGDNLTSAPASAGSAADVRVVLPLDVPTNPTAWLATLRPSSTASDADDDPSSNRGDRDAALETYLALPAVDAAAVATVLAAAGPPPDQPALHDLVEPTAGEVRRLRQLYAFSTRRDAATAAAVVANGAHVPGGPEALADDVAAIHRAISQTSASATEGGAVPATTDSTAVDASGLAAALDAAVSADDGSDGPAPPRKRARR